MAGNDPLTRCLGACGEPIGRAIGDCVGDCVVSLVTTVRRRWDILCRFRENVETMKKTAEALERERNYLQRKIENAFRPPEEIEDNPKNWLEKVEQILKEMRDNIEPRIDRTDCWTKITSAFKLGNKVKATTEEMEELLKEVKGFPNIFRPSPPIGALQISMPPSFPIQSRKQMETDILNSFSQLKVVGIVGMGGLGKTTLAEQILNRMLKDGLVVGAVLVATQPFDKQKIQEKIARSLGCESELKEKSEEDRASILLSKLKAARFLIVLDDIWEEFTLADVGIPHEGECKTLLTSRNKGLLDNMSPKVFEMEILSEEEAQLLFKDKAGTCVDDPPLQSIAKEVVDECKGLTIAIITVGSALKDRPKVIWEGALRDLRRANPKNIKDVIKNVYNPLRKSIDLLDGPNKDDAKKLLLLCSLFPEDHSIRIEELVLYSMGLQMFKGDNSLENARYLVHSEIWNLKSRYLLLDGDKEDEVKMHDVVRDVAIYIASEGKLIDASLELEKDTAEKCCQWISEFVSPRNFLCSPALRRNKFPCLHLLIIHGKKLLYEPEVVDGLSFLKGMPELFVLSFENVDLRGSPNIIEWPKNLLTLRFVGCRMMSDLSFVGELLDLKVLDCNMCYGIEALPVEIKKLKNLKLLNCTGAYRYPDRLHIAPGIISQLTELEELKIMKGWEATEVDGEERMNASLKELESLPKLKCLEIEIRDPTLVNEVIHLSPTVKKYRIWIGNVHPRLTYDRAISLSNLKSEINHQSWIHKLLATTEVEELCLAEETGLGTWRNIWQLIQKTVQNLEISDCEIIMLGALVDTSTISQVFPKLRSLRLSVLLNLEQICDSPLREGSNSFGNLCNVSIYECGMLRNLFLLKRGNGIFFQQLETLEIKDCGEMEEAFISDDEHGEEGGTIGFPKLKKLVLNNMECLRTFAKGFQRIEFPSLEELVIENCRQLESLVCSQQESDEDNSTPLLCTKKITIGTLKKLIIRGCHNIRAIFSFSILESLNSLDDIDISNCDKVEEVLRKVKNEDEENIGDFTFPKLESLKLSELLNLTSLGKGIESIKFSVLKTLWITYCPNLRNLLSPMEYHIQESEFSILKSLLITCCPNLRNLLSPMESHIQESGEGYNHDDESLSSFWNEKVKCKRLNHLYIEECGMASSLLSSSAAENLESLEILSIIDCCHMKKVITGGRQMPGNFKLFPHLEELEIKFMPLLEIFCDWKCGLQLPLLRKISVRECPHMGILTEGSLSIPNLNQVDINYMRFGKARLRGNEDLSIFLREKIMITRVVHWNIPNESDPSEPKILKLLNPHTPTKVVQLCYISVGEVGILALTSDAAHMLWRWKSIGLLRRYSSAPFAPHLVDSFNGAPMCNESNDSVGCFAVYKGEHFLASASGGKISLFCMDHPIECPTKIFRPPPPVTTYLAFHPEKEDVIAIGMEDSTIQIYNWRDNDILSTLEGHQNRISGLAFSSDCKKLVSSGADAQLCVWSIDAWDAWEKEKSCYIHTPTEAGHPAPLVGDTRFQFNSNESELLVVHETQFAIYNVELECLRSWYPSDSFPSTVSCATYSCDGQMIFTGFHEGTIGIFNNSENLTLQCRIAPSAYISSSIPSNDNVFPVAIAAHPLNAGQFAVGMSDGAIYVIEPADLQTSYHPFPQALKSTPSHNPIGKSGK